MKKTYKFLRSFMIVALAVLLFVAAFGTIAFSFMHDSSTYSLKMPHIITIIFYFMIGASFACGIVMAVKSRNLEITRIRKNNPFLMFSSAFCAIMGLVSFIYETVFLIAQTSTKWYLIIRASKWFLLLFVITYFVIQTIPSTFKKRKISIPIYLRAGASIGVIIWAVLGVLVVYFNALNATDVSKIAMLLVYSAFSAFFVFEGLFEFVRSCTVPYIITAIISATLAFGFPFGISVAKVIGLYNPNHGFSYSEMLICFAIGLYCTAKVVAYVFTVHRVILISDSSSHSSKFDKRFDGSKKQVTESEKEAGSKGNQ